MPKDNIYNLHQIFIKLFLLDLMKFSFTHLNSKHILLVLFTPFINYPKKISYKTGCLNSHLFKNKVLMHFFHLIPSNPNDRTSSSLTPFVFLDNFDIFLYLYPIYLIKIVVRILMHKQYNQLTMNTRWNCIQILTTRDPVYDKISYVIFELA